MLNFLSSKVKEILLLILVRYHWTFLATDFKLKKKKTTFIVYLKLIFVKRKDWLLQMKTKRIISSSARPHWKRSEWLSCVKVSEQRTRSLDQSNEANLSKGSDNIPWTEISFVCQLFSSIYSHLSAMCRVKLMNFNICSSNPNINNRLSW